MLLIELPTKLNTKRSHRIIQFLLEHSQNWSRDNRDFSIYWSTSHMITTAQVMRLLAVSRGLDPDISAIAGAIHDIATMETGKHENHAIRSLDFIDIIIGEFNKNNERYIINDDEITLLKDIIPQHSSKDTLSDNKYAEMLKDADAIDRYLHGVETKESEMPRLIKAFSEIGMNIEFES